MRHLNAERVCQCMAGHREGRGKVSEDRAVKRQGHSLKARQKRERIKKPAKRPRRLFSRSGKADQETGLSSFTGSASTFSTFVTATVPIFT